MALAHAEETRPLLGAHTISLLSAFSKLLSGEIKGVDEALQHEMRNFVLWLHGLAPEQLRQMVGGLPEKEQATLAEILQVI